MKRPLSRKALLPHQAVILRALGDLRAGRNADHLLPAELASVIAGLEQRLGEVKRQLEEQPEA